jgi:hypothetical protein
MPWVRDIGSLYDFLGYVVLRAPNRFPREDYLSDEEQMTLNRAFAELRQGVRLVEKDFPGADAKRGLSAILEQALALYRAGDDVGGAHKLQDFERLIFKE